MLKKSLALLMTGALLLPMTSQAQPHGHGNGQRLAPINENNYDPSTNPLDGKRTLDLCVDYSTLSSDADKKAYLTELDRRAQLSVKDHDNFDKKLVEPGSTMCGMYMTLGKPLQEKGKQLRPMVFKVVHIYPDHYYVTQMGMVVEKYERKEGALPPKLAHEKPTVQAPPVIYNTPGGSKAHP